MGGRPEAAPQPPPERIPGRGVCICWFRGWPPAAGIHLTLRRIFSMKDQYYSTIVAW